ncbi:metal ABC transporter permease [Lysobacter sp. KIS68-7]|uniref:metal ABC transporter permease n=1 Tax=Lysobacter sp. KIS68-7 TaxID=2904252 RepID=UPI001E6024B5|nr:metal ABC transporter permease [Lysobacter sp. KIS68-7]UHQ19524.1 metal ABC transporter permease [Lysobacter sp. KIS68-7]
MNLDGLDVSILGPACVAGLIVLSTHVPLGRQVLSRGIIFIDLAIAQVAALGVILAQYLGVDEHGFGVQIAAAVAAFAGAALLAWTDKRWPKLQEPLIGTLFVLAATGGLLLLANNPQGGEHLKDLLVGQILWVSYDQLWPAALLSAALLAFIWWRRKNLTGLAFYGAFALAITISVQLVGVYLVFASLIVPALATVGRNGNGGGNPRRQLTAAYIIGIAGYVLGLALSAVFDLPSGALIVWLLAACGLVAQLVPGVRRMHPAA